MGTKSPYHVEMRWSSSQVLKWHRTKADKLQEFYNSAAKGFSDVAEAPEWRLTRCILRELFSLIREALTAMQGE
jgi:hypothetical protein